MKCIKCSATLNVPVNLVGKSIKCRCGQTLKAVGTSKVKVTTSERIKFHCGNCNRSLNVNASFAGKPVKCSCGHQCAVPDSIAIAPVRNSQIFDGEIDFTAVNVTAFPTGKIEKTTGHLRDGDHGETKKGTESLKAYKRSRKEYTSSMLSEVSSEFSELATTQKSDTQRQKFLLSMSILFASVLIPLILFAIYRAVAAASEGYANWGDRVQQTVVSMKMQRANPGSVERQPSGQQSKRKINLPKQPTPGQELLIGINDKVRNVSDVKFQLENYYPGWVCDKARLDVTGKFFRATMQYKPPPIALPPSQRYSIGRKESAIKAVLDVKLQDAPEEAVEFFLNRGYFSCQIECTEAYRQPGKITLNCQISDVKDMVPALDYPRMNEMRAKIENVKFRLLLEIEDNLITNTGHTVINNQSNEGGAVTKSNAGSVRYVSDPSAELGRAFTKTLINMEPKKILELQIPQ